MIHELAGKPAPKSILVDVSQLVAAYYTNKPDLSDPLQRVSFGTSGHRGSSLKNNFNEDHVLAMSQSICEYRRAQNITGPLFLGMDTHALSKPAFDSALEVFASAGIHVMIQREYGYTPTPVISHAILTYNRGRKEGLADGIVITPSHNPPEDGGFKYNPPHGGPAGSEITSTIETRANRIIEDRLRDVSRIPFQRALKAPTVKEYDYVTPYVKDLRQILNLEAVAGARIKIGADPLGGASIGFWDPIAETYGLTLEVVNRVVDPTFYFMTLDKDGKIRMDCSSPYAMASLIAMKERFDIAFGNDTDSDRHGIVTKTVGLLNPNHYLAAAASYLFQNRPQWTDAALGKSLVSSSILDRVAAQLGRRLIEVPVGFKWFVDGLLDGSVGFAGEESAGASFLRKDGTVWTTDKDGIIMNLLAAEILAVTGKDPAEIFGELVARFGSPEYRRIDAPANPAQKLLLSQLSSDQVTAMDLAGDAITAKITHASGHPIGGLKVVTDSAWFAARPSGTEDIYKIYLESFKGKEHLQKVEEEALALIENIFRHAGV